jgi:hypothetical protein
MYGVRVMEHYHAAMCHDGPIAVVKEFLAILEQNG